MEELESINRIFNTYICATCLADDRDLCYLDQQQRNLLVTLGIKVTQKQKTCWECSARIRNIIRFQLTAGYAHLVHKKRKMKHLDAVGSMSRLKKTNSFTLYTISELEEAVIITENNPSCSLSSLSEIENLNEEQGFKAIYPIYILPEVSNKKSYMNERTEGYIRPLSRTKTPKAEFKSPISSRKNTHNALHKHNLLRNKTYKQSIELAKKIKKKKSKNNAKVFVNISVADHSKDVIMNHTNTEKDAVFKDLTVPQDTVENSDCNATRQLCDKEIENNEDSLAVEKSIIKENITEPLSKRQNINDKTLQTITANTDDKTSQTQHNVPEVKAVAKNVIQNNVNNYLKDVDNILENNRQTVPANKYENKSVTQPNKIEMEAIAKNVLPNNITGTLIYPRNIVENTTVTTTTDENTSQIELDVPELETVVNRITQNDVSVTSTNIEQNVENIAQVVAGISDENTYQTKLGEHSELNIDEYNLQTITSNIEENTTQTKTKDVLVEMVAKSIIQIDINDTQKRSENIFDKSLQTVTVGNISLTECNVTKLEAVPKNIIQDNVSDTLTDLKNTTKKCFQVIAMNADHYTAHAEFNDLELDIQDNLQTETANEDGKTSQTTPYNDERDTVAKTMIQDSINDTPSNTQYIVKDNANTGENTLRNVNDQGLQAVAKIIIKNNVTDSLSDLQNNCTLQNVTAHTDVNTSQTKMYIPELDLHTAKEKERSDNNQIENDNSVLHFDKTYNLSASTTIDESKKYTKTDKKIISQIESFTRDSDENITLKSVKQINTNEVSGTTETDADIDIKSKNTGNTVNDETVKEGIVMNTKKNVSFTSRHTNYTRGRDNLFSGGKKYLIINDDQCDSYNSKESSSYTDLYQLHNIHANNIDKTREVNENSGRNKGHNFMITDQASSETSKHVNETFGKEEDKIPNGNLSFTQVGKYSKPEKTHLKTKKEINKYESVNYLSKRNKNSLLKRNYATRQNTIPQFKKTLIPGVMFKMCPEKKIRSKKEYTDWAVTELNKSIDKAKKQMKKKAFAKDFSERHDDDETDNRYQNMSLLCSEEISISDDSNISTDEIITLPNAIQNLNSNYIHSDNLFGSVRDEVMGMTGRNALVGTDLFTVIDKRVSLSGVEIITGSEGNAVATQNYDKNREPNKCNSVEKDKTKTSKNRYYNYVTENNAGDNVRSKILTLKSKQNSVCLTLGVANKDMIGENKNNTLQPTKDKNNISTCFDKNNTLANINQSLGDLGEYEDFTIPNYNDPSVTTKGNVTYVTPTGAHNAELSVLKYLQICDDSNVSVANDTQNIPMACDDRNKIPKFNLSVIKEARLQVDGLTDQTKNYKEGNHVSQNRPKTGDDRNKILEFNLRVIEEAKTLDDGLTDRHKNDKQGIPVLFNPDFDKKYIKGSDLHVASLLGPEIHLNKTFSHEKVKGAQELVVHRVTDDRSSRLAVKINIPDQFSSNDINIPIHMIEKKSTIAPPIEDDSLCRRNNRNKLLINKLTDDSQIIRCKPVIKKPNASKPAISETFKTVLMDHCYHIYSKQWLYEFYEQKQDPKILQFKIVQNSMGKIRFVKTSSTKRKRGKLDQSNIVQEIIDDFEKEEAVAGVSCPSEKEYINTTARKNFILNESSIYNNEDMNIMVEAEDYSILTDIKVEECNLEPLRENNECDERFDWCIQSCQKEKVDTNSETIFRTSHSTTDLHFNGSITDTASEGDITDMSSETRFGNYYETDEYEDTNEITDTENLESGYNYYQIKPSEYDNYVPPQNYDNDSFEVEPSKETGLDPSDFEMNNITISLPYSIFDDIPKNISVRSTDEINNDVNSAAINIQNSDTRNISPNLLEPRYFTTYQDSTYDHLSKSCGTETADNIKPEHETHKNKVTSTEIESENQLKVTKKSKRKRKLSDLAQNKNDRILRSVRSAKSANNKKILRVVIERLKLDTEKNEENKWQDINLEKLLQRPIVLLEKIVVDKQNRKDKTLVDKENNKLKEPLLSEDCNSFLGTDETCIGQRTLVDKLLRKENKKYSSSDLIQNSIPRNVPKAADKATNKASDADELKTKVSTMKAMRRAIGRSDQVSKSEIDHHRTIKKCLNMKIKANEDGLLPGTPADVFFLRLIPEDEIENVRRNFSMKDQFKKCFYRCNKCIMGFKDFTSLGNHCKKFHEISAGTLMCNICECRFKTEDKLKCHTESHKSIYRCRWCTEEYLYFFGLLTHVRRIHPDERKSYSCKLCHKKYYNLVSLWTHEKTHNFSTPKRVTRYKNLRSTKKNSNSNDGRAFSTGDNLCSNGDDLCSNGDDLGSNGDDLCSYGDDLCSTGDKLSVTDVDMCAKDGDLININATDGNMSIHDNSTRQLNKCDICQKVFRHRSLLVKHRRYHKTADATAMAKNKLHKCEICGREFRLMSSLTNHRKAHKTRRGKSSQHNKKNNCIVPGIYFQKKVWTCNDCHNKYISVNSLRRHRSLFHNTRNIIKDSTFSIENNLSSTDLDLTTTDNNLSSIDYNASSTDSMKGKRKRSPRKMCKLCPTECTAQDSLWGHGIHETEDSDTNPHTFEYNTTDNIPSRETNLCDSNLSLVDDNLSSTDNNCNMNDNNFSLTGNKSSFVDNNLSSTDNNCNMNDNNFSLTGNKSSFVDNNLSSTDNNFNMNDNNFSLTGNKSSFVDNNLSSTDNNCNMNDNNFSLTGNKSSFVVNNFSTIDNNINLTNVNVNSNVIVELSRSATEHVKSNKNANKDLQLMNNKKTLALKIKGRKRSRISLDVCKKTDTLVSLGERNKIMHKIGYSDGKPNRIQRSLSLADSSFSLTDKNIRSTDNNFKSTDFNLSPTDNNLQSTDNNLSPTGNDLKSTDNNLNPTDNDLKSTDNDLKSTDNNLNPIDNDLKPTDNDSKSTDNNLSSTDKELSSTVNIFSPTDNNLSLTDNNVSLIDYEINVSDNNLSVPNGNEAIENVEQSQAATENANKSATSAEKYLNSNEYDKNLRVEIKRKRKCKKNPKRHCRCITQTEHRNKDNKTERSNDITETTLCEKDLSSENGQRDSVAGPGNDEIKDHDNISTNKVIDPCGKVKRKSLLYTCKICQKQFRRSSKDSIKKHKLLHKTADAKSAVRFNLTESKLNLPDVYSSSTRRSKRIADTLNKKTEIDVNLSPRGKALIPKMKHFVIETKRKLKCKVCRDLFSNDIELAVHMSDKHTTGDIVESGISNMTKQGGFKSFSSVSVPGCLPDADSQCEMYTCEICRMKFISSSKDSIFKHKIMHQTDIMNISDNKNNLTDTYLSSTQRSQQVTVNVNTEIADTDLSLYGNEGSSQKTAHLEMESKRKHMCQFCNKFYENEKQLAAHKSDEHEAGKNSKCARSADTNLSLNFSNLSLTDSNISLTDHNMSLTDKSKSLTDKTIGFTKNNLNLTDNNISLTDNSLNLTDKNINLTDNDISLVANQSGPISNNLSFIEVKSSLTHGLGLLEKNSNENKLRSVDDDSGSKSLDLTDNSVHLMRNKVRLLVNNSTDLGSDDNNSSSDNLRLTENASSFTISTNDKSSKNNILNPIEQNPLKEENDLNSTKEKISLFADSFSYLASTDANKGSIDGNKDLIDDNISLSENESSFSISSDDNTSSNNFNFHLTEDSSSTQEINFNFTTNKVGLLANNSCYLASTDDNKGSRDENISFTENDSKFSVSTEDNIISKKYFNLIEQNQSLQENNLNLLESASTSTQSLGAPDESLKDNNLSLKDNNLPLKDDNSSLKDDITSLKDDNSSLKDDNSSLKDENLRSMENSLSLQQNNINLLENYFKVFERSSATKDV